MSGFLQKKKNLRWCHFVLSVLTVAKGLFWAFGMLAWFGLGCFSLKKKKEGVFDLDGGLDAR